MTPFYKIKIEKPEDLGVLRDALTDANWEEAAEAVGWLVANKRWPKQYKKCWAWSPCGMPASESDKWAEQGGPDRVHQREAGWTYTGRSNSKRFYRSALQAVWDFVWHRVEGKPKKEYRPRLKKVINFTPVQSVVSGDTTIQELPDADYYG